MGEKRGDRVLFKEEGREFQRRIVDGKNDREKVEVRHRREIRFIGLYDWIGYIGLREG